MKNPLHNRPVKKGCYTLVIRLQNQRALRVGRLGRFFFPPGTYLYTGSAMNGLEARLARHLRKRDKKSRWHIDYLLKSPGAEVKSVLTYGPDQRECGINQRMAALPGARVAARGFGASDCRLGCASHLVYVGRSSMSPGLIRRRLRKIED